MRDRIFHTADIRLRNPVALSGQEIRKFLLGDFTFKLLFINGACFSNAQRLSINERSPRISFSARWPITHFRRPGHGLNMH